MKSFIVASVISFVATLSGAVPLAEPQTTVTPTPTSTALVTSPPTPLGNHQLPILLPNGVQCIAPDLVMVMSEAEPDKPIARYQQIGPNAFISMDFNPSHYGKACRFHFAISGIADGGPGRGFEEIYALKSGVIDEKLTFNNQPVLEDTPVASFDMSKVTRIANYYNPQITHDMHAFYFRTDFPCPTVRTGWAIRANNTSYNWSWNHGLVVEVSDNGSFWEGGDKF